MNTIIFKSETIKGETSEACCVINKHDKAKNYQSMKTDNTSTNLADRLTPNLV